MKRVPGPHSPSSSPFFDALRVHREPFEYLDERLVHDRLTAHPLEYLGYLDRSLAAIAAGELRVTQPPKLILADADSAGDFRVMPCVVGSGSAVRKTVKIVGTNVVQRTVPDQITVGKAFSLDASDNHITHIVEACLLSSARTGACAAIALRRLAVRHHRVVVVGAGRVGCYAAFYAATLADIEDLTFMDSNEQRARSAAALAADTFGCSTRFTAGRRDGRIDADVIILATTAHSPIIAPGDTDAALVISTGADTLHQHELAPGWAALADVYVDTTDSLQVGDLHAWHRDGLIEGHQVVDLLALVRDPPRPSARQRLFISTGSALFDNLTISYLLEECSRAAASDG